MRNQWICNGFTYEMQEHYCSMPRTPRLEKGRNKSCLCNLNLLSIVCMDGDCREAGVIYLVRYIMLIDKRYTKESPYHRCLLRFPEWNQFEQVSAQARQPQFLCRQLKEIGHLWSGLSGLYRNAYIRCECHVPELLESLPQDVVNFIWEAAADGSEWISALAVLQQMCSFVSFENLLCSLSDYEESSESLLQMWTSKSEVNPVPQVMLGRINQNASHWLSHLCITLF